VAVAKILEPVSDGLELNLSCPHATGYGMAIGQDKELVKEITAAVKASVGIPVIPKLTPNVSNLAEIAKAAVDGGADAICAINTVGPGYYAVDGNPVLSNKKGGMSGKGILPLGLKCVKEISEAVNVPIIGCGGISSADDAREYQRAGASIYGIGSALAGLSFDELKKYFNDLDSDLKNNTNNAVSRLRKTVDMSFKKYALFENRKITESMSLLVFDKKFSIKPGQFVFAWVPGFGEKPFSVLNDSPLTLAIQKKGCLTEKLVNLEKGAVVYFRGPYGNPVNVKSNQKIILVAGGYGLAALYQIARDFKNAVLFVGAKDKKQLFYINELKKCAEVEISTDDGSEGFKGFVTELLQKRLDELKEKNLVFFNCGPEKMILKAIEVETKFARKENIYSSIDYATKCGVGICGSCATKDGKRLCVDGPFIGEEK
jgi:dihydroorotate dehydrogenase (NAD+) catalytic subunit